MECGVGVTLGVTGPLSLAEQTQEIFHHLVPGFRKPLGWNQQLAAEPAIALTAEEAWLFRAPGHMAQWADLSPATRATIGTLRTALGVTGRARIGSALTHPWLADGGARRWEAYLFIGGHAEAVARDLFLDGSTFRGSVRVDRSTFVSGWERGIGVRLRRVGLEYRLTSQAREYRTGPASHSFGGISVIWSPER